MPLLVRRYVVRTLNKIPGYSSQIQGIHINLWRGAYEIAFSGKFEDPKIRVLAAVGFAFQHAFIHSLRPEIDHTIEVEMMKATH